MPGGSSLGGCAVARHAIALALALAAAIRGDPRRCGVRFAEWAEAVRMAATQELNARDPERRAMIDDLEERILRLGKAMTDGA